MHNQPKDSLGFTLTELMITLIIAGVLVGIAIPNFTAFIVSNRLTSYANDFLGTLSLARSEAIKRGVQVTVRRKGDASTVWEYGWDVFVDTDGDNNFSDNGDTNLCETGEDCLLRTYDALPNDYTLRSGGSTYQNYAAYLPSGLSSVSIGDTFRLCNGTDISTSRTIAINPIGRARVSTGNAVSCP